MNTLTEEKLKEWESANKDFWPSDFLSAGDVSALISTAREVSQLREAWDWAVSFLEDMGMDPNHPDLEKWKERLDPYPSWKSEGPSTDSGAVVPAYSDDLP